MTNFILKTIAQSVIIITVALCYAIGIFSVVAPKPMANLFDKTGNTRLSAMYHVRVYEQDKTIDNLVNALAKSIEARNDKYTLKYGEILFAYDNATLTQHINIVDRFLLNKGYVEALERNGKTTS